jgi:hypothetical protein
MTENGETSKEFKRLKERVENLRCSIGALIVIVIILVIMETIELIVTGFVFSYGMYVVLFLVMAIMTAICFFKD